jgi:cell division GTPase FtsZ
MVLAKITGVEFVGINTDSQALARCEAATRIRIGDRLTRGLASAATRTVAVHPPGARVEGRRKVRTWYSSQ